MNVMTHAAPRAAQTVGERTGLLRLALRLDALVSGGAGILVLVGMSAAGPALADLLGMPGNVLWGLGLFLVAYGSGVGLVSAPRAINRTAAWTVVGLNLAWVVESVALVLLGWLPLTTLGVAAVLAQALAVLALAELQWLGLRRSRTTA